MTALATEPYTALFAPRAQTATSARDTRFPPFQLNAATTVLAIHQRTCADALMRQKAALITQSVSRALLDAWEACFLRRAPDAGSQHTCMPRRLGAAAARVSQAFSAKSACLQSPRSIIQQQPTQSPPNACPATRHYGSCRSLQAASFLEWPSQSSCLGAFGNADSPAANAQCSPQRGRG